MNNITTTKVTTKDSFKAEAYRLAENFTLAQMAKAIAKGCRKKSLEAEILNLIGKNADKGIDFSRAAELLSVARYNKGWNTVSSELGKQDDEAEQLKFLNSLTPEQFHQELFASTEYQGVSVGETGGIETYTDSDGYLNIDETVYFEFESDEGEDEGESCSVSGDFSIVVDTKTGRLIDVSSGAGGNDLQWKLDGIDNLLGKTFDGLKEALSIDEIIGDMAGGFTKQINDQFTVIDHKAFDKIAGDVLRDAVSRRDKTGALVSEHDVFGGFFAGVFALLGEGKVQLARESIDLMTSNSLIGKKETVHVYREIDDAEDHMYRYQHVATLTERNQDAFWEKHGDNDEYLTVERTSIAKMKFAWNTKYDQPVLIYKNDKPYLMPL